MSAACAHCNHPAEMHPEATAPDAEMGCTGRFKEIRCGCSEGPEWVRRWATPAVA